MRRGLVGREVTVTLPGGALLIAWGEDRRITMTGPAPRASAARSTGATSRERRSHFARDFLGCRLNIAESETIRALLGGTRDVVVVNSCAVTAEAVRQTRQAIRKARRARPDARLLVTGCAAEIERDQFAAMPEVDGLVANARKLDARAWNVPPAPRRSRRATPARSSRCRTGAITAARSASSRRAAGQAARCRWARSCAKSRAISTRAPARSC
jgi:hypothetical protein